VALHLTPEQVSLWGLFFMYREARLEKRKDYDFRKQKFTKDTAVRVCSGTDKFQFDPGSASSAQLSQGTAY
jgi:hypothetical protein